MLPTLVQINSQDGCLRTYGPVRISRQLDVLNNRGEYHNVILIKCLHILGVYDLSEFEVKADLSQGTYC